MAPQSHPSSYIGRPYVTRQTGEGANTTLLDVEVAHGRHVSARRVSATLGAFVAQYNRQHGTHLVRVSGGGAYHPLGDATTNSIYSARPPASEDTYQRGLGS